MKQIYGIRSDSLRLKDFLNEENAAILKFNFPGIMDGYSPELDGTITNYIKNFDYDGVMGPSAFIACALAKKLNICVTACTDKGGGPASTYVGIPVVMPWEYTEREKRIMDTKQYLDGLFLKFIAMIVEKDSIPGECDYHYVPD